jgi:SAM-dependent methyltransferase
MNIGCICGSTSIHSLCRGHKDGIKIVSCIDCGHWYIPVISDDYNELYESGLYHNGYQKSIGHIPYKDRYDHDYDIAGLRLDTMGSCGVWGELLDIGCSNGAFVHRAREYGYNAVGIDLEKNTGNIDNCLCGSTEVIESNSKDVITMFDSIEHFADMDYIFSELTRILHHNRTLVIEAPDFSCQQFIDEGINWKHVRPLEHIHMLSMKDYLYMLKKYGFCDISVSFPVDGKLCIYATKE